MANDVGLPKFDHGSITEEMRADAARRAQSSENWTMAALITVNGGAIVTLLSKAEPGPALMWALSFFALGVFSALIAGRFAATLAHQEDALHTTNSFARRANEYALLVQERGNPAQIESAVKLVEDARERSAVAAKEYDGMKDPGLPLGIGAFLFAAGCIAAGFALF